MDPLTTKKGETIMTNQTNKQFRDDEIVILTHWDKKEEKWIKTIHPKVGGRLRLAHEDNENMSIITESVRYDVKKSTISLTIFFWIPGDITRKLEPGIRE